MTDAASQHDQSDSLRGRVAIVTGAGRYRGIGRASALRLAQMGADVVITGTGRDPSTFPDDEKRMGWRDIESVADEIRGMGRRVFPVVASVTDRRAVEYMVEHAVSELGRVDILVNNAAAPRGEDRVPVVEIGEPVFRRVLDTKVVGSFLCAQAVARQLLSQGEGGRIVNISSTAGKQGQANMAAYNAANFAINGFTQALALELAPHGITVNAVCPGLIDTVRTNPEHDPAFNEARSSPIPVGRVGTDEEVADLIGYLCSDRAAYITGQAVNINGGVVTAI